MKLPVYLDYAATTPVDPEVAAVIAGCLTQEGIFANPASRSHIYGWQAEEQVENARRSVADLIGADPREIVWTSGATESDNLALKGIAARAPAGRRHIVTSMTEHKAVLDPCAWLEKQGFEVSYLRPQADGTISVAQIQDALRDDTLMLSLMHVNNETGVLNPVAEAGALCRSRDILFHVDAAQSAGKLPFTVADLNVDLMSLSAHKMYGPKGIGALYVRRAVQQRLEPIMHGGGHERGMRSGTLATHQIAGMGKAAQIAAVSCTEEMVRISDLRERLWQGIRDLPGVALNGHPQQRVAGILNVAFAGLDGETLMMSLNQIALSSGSACTSASVDPSFVLSAMGLPDDLAHASLRMSLGRFTTAADIDAAIEHIRSVVPRMQALG